MTPADLAKVVEWERLAEEASPGPWTREPHSITCDVRAADGVLASSFGSGLNSDFVCAARTAVPEMARMLRETLDAVDVSRGTCKPR